MRIERLRLKVRIKGGKRSATRQSQTVTSPDLQFRRPTALGSTADPIGEESIKESRKEEKPMPKPDPTQVADEVYRLMVEEVRMARLRSTGR